MKLPRRNFLHLAAGAAAFGLASQPSPIQAQDWPRRPVTMVVPFAAGGATDIVARLLSPRLSELLGQQVIVENVGGAGGTTGTARVAKAPPDGYQFVLGNVGTHAHNQTLYRKPPYDAVRDFAPVVLIADLSIVLLTRKDFPADNLPEFIAYGKANEAKLQYGSAGAGSSTHLACVLLNAAIGITVTHVPYRGGTPAMQDLLAGRIDYQCPTTSTATAQIEGKTAKGLATLTRNRTALLRGKTVVVDAPDTAFAILLYKMLGVGGLKKDDYKVKPVGGTPLRLDAMLKDKANAAAMLNPPFSIKAESEGLKSLGWAIDVVGPYQSGAAWVMRSWAQANRDTVVKYLQAYVEGMRWTMNPANRAEAGRILAERLKLPQDVASRAYDLASDQKQGFAKDAKFDAQGFRNVLKLRAELLGTWGGIPPSPEKYLDLSYYERALASSR